MNLILVLGGIFIFAGITYIFLSLLMDSDKPPKRELADGETYHNIVVRCNLCGDYNYYVDVTSETHVWCPACGNKNKIEGEY